MNCNFVEGGIHRATLDDSGLMLFSRYELVELLARPFGPGQETLQRESVEAFNGGIDWWDQVACLNYEVDGTSCNDDGFDEEELASKGIAYVRVRQPVSGQLYNVFLTHTDAQCEDKRNPELGQAARFIGP